MLTETKTFAGPDQSVEAYTTRVEVRNGLETSVNIVRYPRNAVKLSIQLFDEETTLLPWCRNNAITEAMGGGFFLRSSGLPLGEVWLDGEKQAYEPYGAGWNGRRGALKIDADGQLSLAPRYKFPKKIYGCMLEVGPTLVHEGVSLYLNSSDPEGFSETAYQHDEDINCKPHPRAAIGMNDDYIWTVTAEGRRADEAGMYLGELAGVFVELGATEAINLDGGRSSTQITGGELLNHPCTEFDERAEGYPLRSAIIFQKF